MPERVRLHLSAAGAILQRDFSIFVSYRWRTVSQLATVILSVTLYHFISRLVRVESFPAPEDYFAFVVVGLIIAQVLHSTLGVPMQLRSELMAGTFERIIMSPFGTVGGVMSMMIFPFLTAVVLMSFMLLFAVVVFDMPLHASTAPLALPVGLLGTLSFAGLGVLLAALTLVFKQATGVAWIIAGISLVGGLYFPIDLLPGWIHWAGEVQPFTPTVDLLRHLLSDQPLQDSAVKSIAKLVGFAFVLLPVSMWALGSAARLSRRRGTIIEY
jgi:ABC-2 type transport system permease protein